MRSEVLWFNFNERHGAKVKVGVLKVRGSAKQDFEIDRFIIKTRIKANDKSSGEAITLGKKRTEAFLHLMKDRLGIEPGDIIAGDYTVNHGYGAQPEYRFSRELSVCVVSDLALVEEMTSLLEKLSDVEYEIEFSLSNEQEKSKEVLSAAIADSASKAEIIAESLGQKIVGVGSVDFDYSESERPMLRGLAKFDEAYSTSLASNLKIPTKTISRSICIEWEVE